MEPPAVKNGDTQRNAPPVIISEIVERGLLWILPERDNINVGDEHMIEFKRILCPTDFSEASAEAFPYAIELGRPHGAEIFFIHVVHVLPPPPADYGFPSEIVEFAAALRKDAEKRIDRFLSERVPSGVRYHTLMSQGHAADEILDAAEKHRIDLITIATHGHTGLRHLVFGSVAEKVVRMATIPVLTVRRKERG